MYDFINVNIADNLNTQNENEIIENLQENSGTCEN